MDAIASLLSELAPSMPWICFGLLVLAGFNLPISEDVVFIVSAALATTYLPERIAWVYVGCFAGAYASDIIAYSIGRHGGRRLLRVGFVRKRVSPERVARVDEYFARYGGRALFFGRFIPFGVRNIVFMTAGFGRMPLPKFLLIDIVPLAITSSVLFYLGTLFGENYRDIVPYLNRYKLYIVALAAVALAVLVLRRCRTSRGRRDRAPGDAPPAPTELVGRELSDRKLTR